ncbi:MAG: hypothetical protein H7096_04980 [Flavobacterium sp.]|nr:hypothetical protein [Pedobacter sp.]
MIYDKEAFKAILERNELNKSAIADKMYPNSKYARTALNNKLNERKSGNDTIRVLTDDDLKKGWEVLKDLSDAIIEKGPRE